MQGPFSLTPTFASFSAIDHRDDTSLHEANGRAFAVDTKKKRWWLAATEKPMVDELLPELILPIEERDHCPGTPGARYQPVEYGDYECPHCAQVEPIVHELLRELEGEI